MGVRPSSRVWLIAVSLAMWSLLSGQILLAQRTTATLYGGVQDSSGAAVPNARVLLTEQNTGAQSTAQSDERGDFTFSFVPVGSYRIEVEANGFQTFSRTDLALAAGQQIRYPIVLVVGAMSEKVTVTAEAPVVQDASPVLYDRVSRMQLEDLPHANRSYTNLLALENGYRPTRDGMIQFNGLAAGGLTITVDGTDGSGSAEVSSPGMFQNFNPIKTMSEEAIQEVAVSKGIMSAEYAHTFSGNVNLITRSGTNSFHGSAFEALQNSFFNAKNAAQKPGDPKAPVHINQFGGSFGGPIRHDKLFFFLAYEGYRQSSNSVSNTQVPTVDYRSQLLAANPSYKPILDLYPLPTSPVAGSTTVGLYQGLAQTTTEDNNVVAKVDYLLSSANRLSFRYNRLRPESLTPRNPPTFHRNYFGINESGTTNFTHSATTWTAETRFGYNLVDVRRVENLWELGIPAISLKNVVDTQGEGYFKRGHTYSIEEVVAKNIGRHALKFGGLYAGRAPGNFDEQVPTFTFSNTADLLANKPSAVQVTLPIPDYHARNWELGFFVQDDFRVRPNLMLNIGMRYEYFSVLKEEEGRLYNPDGPLAAVTRPVQLRPGDSEYRNDPLNFSPRVGFTWNPFGGNKTVVRGGGGIFYAQPLLNNFTAVYTDPAIPSRFNLAQSDITALGLQFPVTNDQFLALLKTRNIPAGYNVIDPNYQNPYNVQWTFDIQRQFGSSFAFETGYVGNKGLKIAAAHNFNLPDRVTGIRPFPDSLQIGYLNNSDFSYYHAWQSSLRKRFSHGLMFNLHYTWARAMSINEGDFYSGNNARVQDETNWRANKGPATGDIAHRFVADAVYELPFGSWLSGHRSLRQIVGGWQLAGTFTAQSGDRLDITEKSNYDSSRPDYLGGNIYADNGDKFQWLNPAAFAQVPISKASGVTIRPGNIGKYVAVGPASWNPNLSLARVFAFGERVKFQLRADAFSVLNHPTLGNPQTEITSATFGRILSVGGSRSMQMYGRITF